tara:strand:- start:701 stop:1876 length:1176 start_codon:yes stop_codon:yes gene_type:complete
LNKNDIIIKIKRDHINRYDTHPAIIAIAPGRINIIGEHTDYNDGFAMPVAINKYVFAAISKNTTNSINAYSDEINDSLFTSLDELISYKGWHKYILGAVNEIFKKYNIKNGLNISIFSNLPIGKGMSSSAAIEIATVNAILKLFKIDESDKNKIRICQKIDHKYIGIKSGILDHSASQLSKINNVLKIDFNREVFSYVKMKPMKASWILIDSKVKRELVNTHYNQRVKECEKGLSLLSNLYKKEISFRGISDKDLLAIKDVEPILFKRLKHVLDENNRVHEMEKFIISSNLEKIGKILVDSHYSLRDLYEVSCPELDYLVSLSSKFKYWYGGRIMGGGFGGNSINLIKQGKEEEYYNYIIKNYKRKFNIDVDTYKVNFSKGVEIIDNISAD